MQMWTRLSSASAGDVYPRRVRPPDLIRAQADRDAREAAEQAIYDVLALSATVCGGIVDDVTRPALYNLARMTVDHLLRR